MLCVSVFPVLRRLGASKAPCLQTPPNTAQQSSVQCSEQWPRLLTAVGEMLESKHSRRAPHFCKAAHALVNLPVSFLKRWSKIVLNLSEGRSKLVFSLAQTFASPYLICLLKAACPPRARNNCSLQLSCPSFHGTK